MDCLARVLYCRVAQDGYLARLGVNLHIHDVRGESAARSGRIEICSSNDGTARLCEALSHFLEADAQFGVGLVAESAVGEADLINIRLPHQSRALNHLALHVLSRLEARPARLEGCAAPSCHGGIADSFSVADLRVHILDRNAQHLGELLRGGWPCAANVHRADGQVDCAIVVDIRGGASGAGAVHPESCSHAAPAIGAFERRLVVVVVSGSFVCLDAAYHWVDDAVAAPCAFLRAVHNAEVERVDVELAANLVYDLLRRERCARRAGGAVGCRLGLVVHHIVAVEPKVLHIVGRVYTVHRSADG